MGNRLFQEARKFVQLAKEADGQEKQAAIKKAKNALESAYANSNVSEQRQLHHFQDELEKLE